MNHQNPSFFLFYKKAKKNQKKSRQTIRGGGKIFGGWAVRQPQEMLTFFPLLKQYKNVFNIDLDLSLHFYIPFKGHFGRKDPERHFFRDVEDDEPAPRRVLSVHLFSNYIFPSN
jgi:hypothetical protein